MNNNFKCSNCFLDKEKSQLGLVLEKNNEVLLKQLNNFKLVLVELKQLKGTFNNIQKEEENNKNIEQLITGIKAVENQIKTDKQLICKVCLNISEFNNSPKFTCFICGEESEDGKKHWGHVRNYPDKVSPKTWTYFCSNCKKNRILYANIYCPRLSDGRDDDWDINKPLFDCDCPTKEDQEE